MCDNMKSCKVDAVVTVDSKGQIVLPKDLREKAKLKPNDKLAVMGCGGNGEICCIIMVKAEDLGETMKNFLGPMLKKVLE
jgi:AbrB family looped-hinge helix DNA binding protein